MPNHVSTRQRCWCFHSHRELIMKTFFVAALLVLAVAGCSTWGTGRTYQQPAQGAGGITPSPTGVSSHNRIDG